MVWKKGALKNHIDILLHAEAGRLLWFYIYVARCSELLSSWVELRCKSHERLFGRHAWRKVNNYDYAYDCMWEQHCPSWLSSSTLMKFEQLDRRKSAGFLQFFLITAPVECQSNQFACASGIKCINPSYVCDTYNDCEDGSDEQNCGKWNNLTL